MKGWREVLGFLLEKKAEKRKSPRKRITFAIKYRMTGKKADETDYTYTLGTDISLIGLAIYGVEENFIPDTVLDFEFPFPDSFNQEPLHFQGVVVHKHPGKSSKKFSYGIKFVNMDSETLAVLKDALKLEE